MVRFKSDKILKMQKNRFYRNPKTPALKFGDFGLITKNEGRLELIQLTFMKRLIKAFITKKKNESDIIREKIWYFGCPNFYLQKKSKNSRMGKGKGLIERKVLRVRRGFVLFEFLGIPLGKLEKLIIRINKKLSVRFFILRKYVMHYSLWSKKSRYTYYHDKYLIQ